MTTPAEPNSADRALAHAIACGQLSVGGPKGYETAELDEEGTAKLIAAHRSSAVAEAVERCQTPTAGLIEMAVKLATGELESERDSLRALVVRMREKVQAIETHSLIHSSPYIPPESRADIERECREALSLVPADVADAYVLVKRGEWEASKWRTGLPTVEEGRQRVFLCSVKGCETPMTLIYNNRYIADISDGQDDPGDAVETSPDSGEYYWTGWFEEGCSQCDTFWRFDREVEAWMELPARAALRPEAKGGA